VTYVALITGASSGIGEATARRLSREPDTQLVFVTRRLERLERLAGEPAPTPVTIIATDLTDADAPAQVRDVVQREHDGQLHMLVNNAGAAWRGTFEETGWANVERHMRLNFEAPVRLTETLLPLLRATASRRGESERRVCIVSRRHPRRGPGREARTLCPAGLRDGGGRARRCAGDRAQSHVGRRLYD
jgi:short-subunit dehydrogenase